MIDFASANPRQDSVCVDGEYYPIHTEYYWWFNFEKIINQARNGAEIAYAEFDKFYLSEPPANRAGGFKELEKFYLNEQPLPRSIGGGSGARAVDLHDDSERIRAEFLSRYGIDLIGSSLHWHCFMGLFNALVWPLDKVMEARMYKDKYRKGQYEKAMKECREMWALESADKIELFKMR